MVSSEEKVVYDGKVTELPDFLPWYSVPVPAAFFKALFKQYSKNGKPYFIDDAYLLDIGDVVYSHKDAYSKHWGKFLELDSFLVQIQAVTGKGNPDDSMTVEIYRPDKNQVKVEKQDRIETTQKEFLRFLRTGDLTVFHP